MGLLHWCCDRGHAELVYLLLNHNVNINTQDGDGQTALHYGKYNWLWYSYFGDIRFNLDYIVIIYASLGPFGSDNGAFWFAQKHIEQTNVYTWKTIYMHQQFK